MSSVRIHLNMFVRVEVMIFILFEHTDNKFYISTPLYVDTLFLFTD